MSCVSSGVLKVPGSWPLTCWWAPWGRSRPWGDSWQQPSYLARFSHCSTLGCCRWSWLLTISLTLHLSPSRGRHRWWQRPPTVQWFRDGQNQAAQSHQQERDRSSRVGRRAGQLLVNYWTSICCGHESWVGGQLFVNYWTSVHFFSSTSCGHLWTSSLKEPFDCAFGKEGWVRWTQSSRVDLGENMKTFLSLLVSGLPQPTPSWIKTFVFAVQLDLPRFPNKQESIPRA